ncbi:Transcription elongation factor [Parasponia andersonii]|uniref:Transcription elongation factor n=1 Tax=Parasponia andersonii TaxID=3476 RepID=A0A2P5A4E0_PARAD|nr:Transcription elongation factor [Parasponia andersonii]
MDYDDLRTILDSSGVDVWTLIDTAIAVASMDYGGDLKKRRDGIVERLYAATATSSALASATTTAGFRSFDADQSSHSPPRQYDQDAKASAGKERVSPATPRSVGGDEDEDNEDGRLDSYGGLFDDEQKRVLEIKEHLEDPDQSEDSLVGLLQTLADMDITFQALRETDIGRHVNRLRKHSSSEVRRLVKQLVRKWKDIVDEWVKFNQPGEHASAVVDGDSPPQKIPQNGHHQVPDFAYSPNTHNGSSGSDKNSEPERKPKAVPPRREAPPKPATPSVPQPHSAPQNRQREQKESNFDLEKLASARKRLQANYKEAENAKKQRTIQVMDIHEIPKPKSKTGFFPKNKGGSGGSMGRH